MSSKLSGQFKTPGRPFVIGMLHAPPLPGSPRFGGSMRNTHDIVLRDADALAKGGVDGLMIENFGDAPFFPGRVPTETVTHLCVLAEKVRQRFGQLPLGINCLRNDGLSALAIAHATGASYIRVNVLCGARVTDQGLIQGIAHDLLRLRSQLRADDIAIIADVDVKHSAPLAVRPIEDEIDDTLHRGLADALVASGAGTGKPTDPNKVATVKACAGRVPVLLGSGVNEQNVQEFIGTADGLIVGTSFKQSGDVDNPVDAKRVKRFMSALK